MRLFRLLLLVSVSLLASSALAKSATALDPKDLDVMAKRASVACAVPQGAGKKPVLRISQFQNETTERVSSPFSNKAFVAKWCAVYDCPAEVPPARQLYGQLRTLAVGEGKQKLTWYWLALEVVDATSQKVVCGGDAWLRKASKGKPSDAPLFDATALRAAAAAIRAHLPEDATVLLPKSVNATAEHAPTTLLDGALEVALLGTKNVSIASEPPAISVQATWKAVAKSGKTATASIGVRIADGDKEVWTGDVEIGADAQAF